MSLVPFIFLHVSSLFVEGYIFTYLSFALYSYAAIILSFLGGIQWGASMIALPNKDPYSKIFGYHFGASVLPPLLGWLAFFFDDSTRFLFVAIIFASVFFIDLRFEKMNIYPNWYIQLRKPLTIVVVLILVSAAFRVRLGSIKWLIN